MRSAPVVAARIVLDGDQTPRSAHFDDVYHPSSGALAQARHVFLAGNGLPARWRGRDAFVVLETGFGLGNNFLALWRAWRDDAERPCRLHVVAIDAHPPTREVLAALPRDEPLRELAAALVNRWPPLVFGLHSLRFDDDGVELLLAFGDVAAWLPQIVAGVDAFFLDGFAPARNPAMWEPRLFKSMARLAAPGATAATWSAARGVRDGLHAAGFVVQAAPGSGGKREITTATFAPRFAPPSSPRRLRRVRRDARIVIVGAGLAGCATALALARHGLACTIVDRAGRVAAGASGNPAAIFHGTVHGHDGRHARWHRAAALTAADAVDGLVAAHGANAGSTRGLLRLAAPSARHAPGGRGGSDDERAALRNIARALGLPDAYARPLDADEASAIAEIRLDRPGWLFTRGGWVDPGALAHHLLASTGGLTGARTGIEIAAIARDGEQWRLHDAAGNCVDSADVVICANAFDARTLLGDAAAGWPLTKVRGQLSAIDFAGVAGTLPSLPIAGAGYAMPVGPRRLWFGATAQRDDADPAVRLDDHLANWHRMRGLLPSLASAEPGFAAGRTAFRCSSEDGLPIVGAVPDASPATGTLPTCPEQPRFAVRQAGLHVLTALGSRGVASSALGGAIIAASIAGAPLPVEADLLDAVDPARFASRRVRRLPSTFRR